MVIRGLIMRCVEHWPCCVVGRRSMAITRATRVELRANGVRLTTRHRRTDVRDLTVYSGQRHGTSALPQVGHGARRMVTFTSSPDRVLISLSPRVSCHGTRGTEIGRMRPWPSGMARRAEVAAGALCPFTGLDLGAKLCPPARSSAFVAGELDHEVPLLCLGFSAHSCLSRRVSP